MSPSVSPYSPAAPSQYGERDVLLEDAWRHGTTAARELGLTYSLTPMPAEDPGAWCCTLHRDGREVPGGRGSGKGAEPAARVGALFEALEHHLTAELPTEGEAFLLGAHEIAAGPLGCEAAATLLAEGPDLPMACLPYQSLNGDGELAVPLFWNTPDYLTDQGRARAGYGDTYPYDSVCRYSMNNGWAAGTTPTEALVHAVNEIIERDAMSLLLVDQFITRTPGTLRVVDPRILPADLRACHRAAETRVGQPVSLLEATTDLGVPAYWAYTPAPAGAPARIRGAGASLSPHYAAERALTELVQTHSAATTLPLAAQPSQGHTRRHPALHRCHLADFSTVLPRATTVPFTDRPSPATPQAHLEALLRTLSHRGFTAYARHRHVSEHLAVVNVIVPGLERFVLVTDDQIVLPGRRGLDRHRQRRTATAPK
ncbi:YcaO-like family protein [Kitasatospora sp. NPDC048298]|uniref:YcaO-like family protein n=1 Tax=Kitasatospora sp. NPDC048298 TaxID=3364049 RepID=UPI003717EA54